MMKCTPNKIFCAEVAYNWNCCDFYNISLLRGSQSAFWGGKESRTLSLQRHISHVQDHGINMLINESVILRRHSEPYYPTSWTSTVQHFRWFFVRMALFIFLFKPVKANIVMFPSAGLINSPHWRPFTLISTDLTRNWDVNHFTLDHSSSICNV